MCAPLAEHISDRAVGKSPVALRRRGTVLVLVVGVLVMVMLIGTALLMTTRSETARVATDKSAVDADALLEEAVDHVLDLLTRDLWGLDDVLFNGNPSVNPLRPGEVYDEPFDGFSTLGMNANQTWEGDAWLASTIPYHDPGLDGTAGTADDRLVWRRVSWTPLHELAALDSIRTLVQAAFGGGVPRGLRVATMVDDFRLSLPRDGVGFQRLKLFYLDADGDGIRDSVRLMRQFPGSQAERFDLAIRIVDNGSMLNLNTCAEAAAWAGDPERGTGRHVTELLADPVFESVVPGLTDFTARRLRAVGLNTDISPSAFSTVYVRAGLLAGWPLPLYNPADNEAALRHRHQLVPYATAVAFVSGHAVRVGALERDFFTTLIERTGPQVGRANEAEAASNNAWPSWMRRMSPINLDRPTDPAPDFNRRPLLTTLSRDHEPMRVPPSIARGTVLMPPGMRLPLIVSRPEYLPSAFVDPGNPEHVGLPVRHFQTGETIAPERRFDRVDVNANPLGMALGQDIDGDGEAGTPADDVAVYASQLAGAMWLVLVGNPGPSGVNDDVGTIQGRVIDDVNRNRLAWQFAANLLDYRDDNFLPTVIGPANAAIPVPGWSGKAVYGMEPRPFITEVYAEVAGADDAPDYDNSLYAVELHNPYSFPVNLDGFRLRTAPVAPSGDPLSIVTSGEIDLSGLTLNKHARRVFYRGSLAGLLPGGVFTEKPDLVIPGPKIANGQTAYIELVRTMRDGESVVLDRIEALDDGFGDPGTKQVIWREWDAQQITLANLTHGDLRFETGDSTGFLGDNESGKIGFRVLPLGQAGLRVQAAVPTRALSWDQGLAAPWAFNSLFDLSAIYLVGDDARTLTDGVPHTLPQFIMAAQMHLHANWPDYDPDPSLGRFTAAETDRRGAQSMAGRVDFVNPELVPVATGGTIDYPVASGASIGFARETWAHRIFDYFTVRRAAHDGQDNDGDGVGDEITEDYDMRRSVAGRLNINTAPEIVLRAAGALRQFGADRSSVIVAYREGRPLEDRSFETGTEWPPWPNGQRRTAMIPYRRVADLTRIDRAWVELATALGQTGHKYRFSEETGEALRRVAGKDLILRDEVFSRVSNLLTTRSDVFTVYIALVDNNGTPTNPDDDRYVRRTQFTVDRTNCYRGRRHRPEIIARQDAGYYDVAR